MSVDRILIVKFTFRTVHFVRLNYICLLTTLSSNP